MSPAAAAAGAVRGLCLLLSAACPPARKAHGHATLHPLTRCRPLAPYPLQPAQTTFHGLSVEEAAKRLIEYGPNKLPESTRNPFLVFLGYMWNPLSWAMEAAAIIAIALLDYADFALIVALLFLNAIISFVEESSADKAIKVQGAAGAGGMHACVNGASARAAASKGGGGLATPRPYAHEGSRATDGGGGDGASRSQLHPCWARRAPCCVRGCTVACRQAGMLKRRMHAMSPPIPTPPLPPSPSAPTVRRAVICCPAPLTLPARPPPTLPLGPGPGRRTRTQMQSHPRRGCRRH